MMYPTDRMVVYMMMVATLTAVLCFIRWVLYSRPFLASSSDDREITAAITAALTSDDDIRVIQRHTWYAFVPNTVDDSALVSNAGDDYFAEQPHSKCGVILYPGAFVDEKAYAPLGRRLASQGGIIVAVVRVPMGLSNFGTQRANHPIEYFRNIQTRWVIGGHSLGGSTAPHYLVDRNHRDEACGLLLLASYVSEVDLHNRADLHALSVLAENDTICLPDACSQYAHNLPPKSQRVVIPGGNHSGFGHYPHRTYPMEDGPRTISREEQQQCAVTAILDWLQWLHPWQTSMAPCIADIRKASEQPHTMYYPEQCDSSSI